MKRYFTNKDVESWNKRLEGSGISIHLYDNRNLISLNSYQIFVMPNKIGTSGEYKISKSEKIDFYFAFSVTEKAKYRFFSLLDIFMSEGMEFNVRRSEENTRHGFSTLSDREILKKDIRDFDIFKVEKDHIINKIKYTQYIYSFRKESY